MSINSRRFSSFYSAAAQRRQINAGWRSDDFLVHLRIDALLAQYIVLPDTYILDGAFFLDFGPEDLRERIGRGQHGRVSPLEVRTRRATLAESLRWLLVREGAQHLNGFPFNAIADERVRDALADELAKTSVADYLTQVGAAQDVPLALSGFLRSRLERTDFRADHDVERMRAGWARWIEAETFPERFRRLEVKPWERGLDVAAIASQSQHQLSEETDLHTQAGRDLYRLYLAQLARGDTFRSDAVMMLRHAQHAAASPRAQEDLATVRAWYDRMRHRAVAAQHDCTTLAYPPELGATPVGPLERTLRQAEGGKTVPGQISLPADFYTRILRMDDDDFGRAAAQDFRLKRWWESGDDTGLMPVIDEVLKTTVPPGAKPKLLLQVFGGLTEMLLPTGGALRVIATESSDIAVGMETTKSVVEFLRTDAHHVNRF